MFYLVFGLLQLASAENSVKPKENTKVTKQATNEKPEIQKKDLPKYFSYDKEVERYAPDLANAPTDTKLESPDGTYWIVERRVDGADHIKIGRQYRKDGSLMYTYDCTTFTFA
ncbi:hypothetical protein TVAG_245730 [Trichomonas vaginalis G3]|uniref:Uncharacterized protein n=1 Tax=Trichomonas vaginalis (strain ATCC PRA-98 / G3) TaxID=412133 RepID=A2E4N1_TRIV3|nr:hypothetical protein TVAGG3_0862240 [Trichomonas vaginalis G3]EAY12341.1 hypothetical protein TVAG_245730 [Trichomonas vaginalis G3]KAI5500755.1 hypothetical protein TVAGG3_0862240 [Trichomonas vaginalis G3]|eukprot:XP_001324564.1 hypothetical protein [Trichomonas vaginalis G3]